MPISPTGVRIDETGARTAVQPVITPSEMDNPNAWQYQGAANAYDFGYPKTEAQKKSVSTLSSTEGENIYNKTVTEPLAKAEQQQQNSQGKATEPPKPEDTLLQNEVDATKTEEQKNAENKKKELEGVFAPIVAEGDAILNSQIATINSQYDQLVRKQEEANARRVKLEETIGIRSGVARYTAGTAGDLVQEQVNIGLAKISEINAKRQDAIAAVQSEHRKGNMTLAFEKARQLQKIDDDRDNAIRDLNKEMREANKKIEERNRLISIDSTVSDLMASGIADPNKIAQELKKKGILGTAKEIGDAFTSLIPPKVAQADISADERIFAQMKKSGVLPPEATMFDFWKKKDEATRDPKSTDPLLQIIRELTIQGKIDEMNNFLKFEPKDKKEFDYADGFRMAISDASSGQQKQRGFTFSKFMENGQYDKARDYIFKTALETSGIDDQRQIGGAVNMLKAFNDFQNILTEMSDAGIPTDIISGTAEDIVRKLGKSTDPNYVYFKGRASNALQQYRRAMTGVAFSPSESEEYKNLFPNYKNDIAVNNKLLSAMKDSLQLQVDGFYQRKLGEDIYNQLASEGVTGAFGASSDTPKTVNIQGQEIEVGSVVENKSGMRGRVEADGTITPIQ